MVSFSIDDVRTTIRADVRRFVGVIDEDARRVIHAVEPASVAPQESLGRVSDAGHAIYGTSGLVGVESLSSSAATIERLAEQADYELRLAEKHRTRARDLMNVCIEGAREMAAMLELELEHRSEEAQLIAQAWQRRAVEAEEGSLANLSPVEEPPLVEDDAFEFDSDDDAPVVEPSVAPEAPPVTLASKARNSSRRPPSLDELEEGWDVEGSDEPVLASLEEHAPNQSEVAVASEGTEPEFAFDEAVEPTVEVADELREIFAQEAREHLVALQGHLSALTADPTDLAVASRIERLFHTLKGAAATVGLEEASGRAADLQQRLETVVEQGQTVDRAFLTALVQDANSLLECAGLPNVTFSVARTVPRKLLPGRDEVQRRVFQDEARRILVDVDGRIEKLAAANEEERGRLVEALGEYFHRLKGSALVMDESAVADVASELESACENGEATTSLLSRGMAQLTALLGLGSAPAELERGASNLGEAKSVFLDEARELLAEIRFLLREYGDASGSRAHELQSELGRLFHRLKGSASVVAEDNVALEAGVLQRLCEDAPGQLPAPVALRVGLVRLASALGVNDESRSTGAVSIEPVRETVQVATDAELWEAFTQECSELLDFLDRQILALEESDSPKNEIEALSRAFHTLKGIVNTMGLAPTGRVLHRVEDFLEGLVASPVLPAPNAIASFLLQVQVEVRRNLKQARGGWVETSPAKLDARAARVLAGKRSTGSMTVERSNGSQREGSQRDTGASERRTPWESGDATDRRFIRVATERLDTLMNLAGELVVSRSRLMDRVHRLRGVQQDLRRSSRRLLETVESFREDHEFANLDGRRSMADVGLGRAWTSWVASAAALRQPEARVVDGDAPTPAVATGGWSAFSELELDRYEDVHVLSRSLAEITSDFEEMNGSLGSGLSSLADDSDAFDAIVSGIQGEITRARMVPVDSVFSRLRLPVRDAAARENKDVRVVTTGEEVNVDKTIADTLFQPMLHLVRNAVFHGIEKSTLRQARGKPALGTVTLNARQESGQIVIEVRDDGRGLDLEKLRARGIALGLISAEVPVDDPTVKDLIFVHGLSTAETASAVAGRGVGCDVVRRAVERLNGSIRVESVPGHGTSFIVTLPLTLAITKALLVRQNDELFAVPLYFAERILDTIEHPIVESAGIRRLKVDGSFVPIRSLGALLGATETTRSTGPVLVLCVGDHRTLLQVDAVVGQEEIVVKPLGELLASHPMLAGVTIRGSGELALILDVPGVIDHVRGVTLKREARPEILELQAPRIDVAPALDTVEVVQPVRATTGKLRVLFVDDSLSVRKVAETYLEEIGVDVTLAVDGIDALAKLREGHFDLVFTDLEMPRMHGYELIRELRFLPAYRELPIVVVTSRSGQKHQDQARALGASEYLTKPFTPKHLAGALARWAGFKSGLN